MSIAVVAGNAAADPEIGLLAVLAGVPAGSPWCAAAGPVCQGRRRLARPCPFQRSQAPRPRAAWLSAAVP